MSSSSVTGVVGVEVTGSPDQGLFMIELVKRLYPIVLREVSVWREYPVHGTTPYEGRRNALDTAAKLSGLIELSFVVEEGITKSDPISDFRSASNLFSSLMTFVKVLQQKVTEDLSRFNETGTLAFLRSRFSLWASHGVGVLGTILPKLREAFEIFQKEHAEKIKKLDGLDQLVQLVQQELSQDALSSGSLEAQLAKFYGSDMTTPASGAGEAGAQLAKFYGSDLSSVTPSDATSAGGGGSGAGEVGREVEGEAEVSLSPSAESLAHSVTNFVVGSVLDAADPALVESAPLPAMTVASEGTVDSVVSPVSAPLSQEPVGSSPLAALVIGPMAAGGGRQAPTAAKLARRALKEKAKRGKEEGSTLGGFWDIAKNKYDRKKKPTNGRGAETGDSLEA